MPARQSNKSAKAIMTSLRVLSHGKLYLEMKMTIDKHWVYRQHDWNNLECPATSQNWSHCRFTDNKGFVRSTDNCEIIHYPLLAISEPGPRKKTKSNLRGKKRRKKTRRRGKLGTLWRQYKNSTAQAPARKK